MATDAIGLGHKKLGTCRRVLSRCQFLPEMFNVRLPVDLLLPLQGLNPMNGQQNQTQTDCVQAQSDWPFASLWITMVRLTFEQVESEAHEFPNQESEINGCTIVTNLAGKQLLISRWV